MNTPKHNAFTFSVLFCGRVCHVTTTTYVVFDIFWLSRTLYPCQNEYWKWQNKVLLWCQQYISFTKYSDLPCMCTFFKMYNNWFYIYFWVIVVRWILFKGVDRSLCGHICYNMHYTTAKVILVVHVQVILKMLM